MNRTYIFKYKRNLFWHKVVVTGHKYVEEQDKMMLFYPDGSIREIKKWVDCECFLGTDWVLVTKETIKEEAGNA